MTNDEAIKYLISPTATSTEPSAEYLKQKEAYDLAIKALEEKTQGEWIHIGSDEWCCSECGCVITTEGSWEHPLSIGAYHCENCGADMRKGGAE